MRYTKILLAIVLISMLVFGSTLSGFAVDVTYHVTTSVLEGLGTVTPGGDYAYDAPVSVTATPDDGYQFVKWIITCANGINESTLPTYNFTMHEHDVTLEACFEEEEAELIYKLTAFAADASMGTVSGSGDYGYTQFVDVKATPNLGYKFVGWEVCFNGAGMNPLDKPASFTCNLSLVNDYVPNVYLRATFELLPANASVKVHYLDENFDFMIPEEIITGVLGTPYVTVAKVFPGYELIATPVNATGTFGTVQGHVDYLYKPVVTPVSYTVSRVILPMWSGTVTGTGDYLAGASVTLKAIPELGYYFNEWDYNAAVITPTINGDEMTFIMPNQDVEVTAVFNDAPSSLATIKYVNTSGGSIKADTQVLLFVGPYTQNAPAIAGYQHIYSSPNRVGTITEDDGDFVITHVYQVPPATQVITNTVTETVYVNVPATTQAITLETVPLAAPVIVNFDEIIEDDVVNFDAIVEDEVLNFDEFIEDETLPAGGVEVIDEEVPLADALPATGQLSVEYFYGFGGLISGLGLWLKRRK